MQDENLFEIKQKFLRSIPHPKVIAKYGLQLNPNLDFSIAFSSDLNHDLLTFLEEYLVFESKIKLGIANALHPSDLAEKLSILLKMQTTLISTLAEIIPVHYNAYESIKISEPFTIYEILKELKSLNYPSPEFKTAIEMLLYSEENTKFGALLTNGLRAKKIKDNG